ncbi:valine--tRNA ligase [Mycoplasmopsis pulmonis]|uniref:valine--tRNA ligase n=1 Tax=Mycoplasmopsis pulmonis TaxID=2107 RepID=UPI002ACD2DF2|nr:valine--tRNA ligase [Mycoplasmopsis pulmonis]MDZ7293216.1 valine--tRNA ligase [Mycoplasmopsis pulmonis]
MDSKYNHYEIEKDKNQKWIDKKYFINHDLDKKPFSIILPPPNVTGQLHLGHALNGYLQDSVIRYKKLEGYDVLFLPAMDHAGIATQIKVEESLAKENFLKQDIGREKFLKFSYQWKDKYANIIKSQWNKLGLALDYSSERFTLDQDSKDAVNKVFIDLYNAGIIYQGVKGINWDPLQKTALSNVEVINKETPQKMYYIKYFLENSDEFVEIATVRTETLYSDRAIGINPNDPRAKNYVNKFVIHPLTKKRLPIITDDYIDQSFASGFMKISAHSLADIDILNKNNLEIVESIDESGFLTNICDEFEGMERFEAREKIAQKLQKENLISRVENYSSNIGYSDRTKVPIEILVKKQWFVKMDLFSKMVLDSLESKNKVNFYPSRFKKNLEGWMNKTYDWTISRQLWWGHQIPAWYKDEQTKVQLNSPGPDWTQDPDVLDTWFSSAIAPFSFFGWPNTYKKLKRYYPTSLLVTGHDIIFFWVSRMYFSGLYFMKDKPFNDVLLHGLIRDEQRRKMTKSLGNGIDPMVLIDQYGSDSLRWFLITNTTPGLDITYNEEKIKSSWNFMNKLWNIARFINLQENTKKVSMSKYDYWISDKFNKVESYVKKFMKKYEFTLIGKEIYKFIINDFSSWYLEFSKITKNIDFQKVIFKRLLLLLHPFIPFLTDHLFKIIYDQELLEHTFENKKLKTQKNNVDQLILVIRAIREFREKYQISKKEKIKYWIQDCQFLQEDIDAINFLTFSELSQNSENMTIVENIKIFMILPKNIEENLSKEKAQKIEFLKFEIKRAQSLLLNEKFISKAPTLKVEEEKAKLEKYQLQLKELLDEKIIE